MVAKNPEKIIKKTAKTPGLKNVKDLIEDEEAKKLYLGTKFKMDY